MCQSASVLPLEHRFVSELDLSGLTNIRRKAPADKICHQTKVVLGTHPSYFLSRKASLPLAVFDCVVGLYINSARAGATRNCPGTWTRIAYCRVMPPSK